MHKYLLAAALPLVMAPLCGAFAEEGAGDKKSAVTFGGFIDTYYAYDFNEPAAKDRAYATQPSRHNELNVSLAFVEAKLALEKVRGRLALQAGTSVQANYAGETEAAPAGRVPSLLRNLQEAVIGYRVADKLWIDAGVHLSHIGFESFLSRDNWAYSRSLMADFSPYYQTGVKASYQATEQLAVSVHVLNGWQNITESNDNKALGVQVAYSPSESVSLTYNNFYGEETGTLWRVFNDFIVKVKLSEPFQVAATFDIGLQRNPAGGSSTWYAGAAFARYQLAPGVFVTARIERYADPNRILATPVTAATAFVANGASVNVDYELAKGMLWRNEVRHLQAEEAVFPAKTGPRSRNTLLVTSLALSF